MAKTQKIRGDFNEETKLILAKQAGERCSICGNGTSKPNSNSRDFTNLGEAAHIRGNKQATNNRFDSKMTDQERSDISNGIWLCRVCHKKIDTDETRYTIQLLEQMKANHLKNIDDGYYDQKFPEYEQQQKIIHDQGVFKNSELVLNEVSLNAFLGKLTKNRFIYWDDEDLARVNNCIEFHNLHSNAYMLPEINTAYEKFKYSLYNLETILYRVEQEDKKFDILLMNHSEPYFIGMQAPPDFTIGFLWNQSGYFLYRSKFNKYAADLDKAIARAKSNYVEYRQLVKQTLFL